MFGSPRVDTCAVESAHFSAGVDILTEIQHSNGKLGLKACREFVLLSMMEVFKTQKRRIIAFLLLGRNLSTTCAYLWIDTRSFCAL